MKSPLSVVILECLLLLLLQQQRTTDSFVMRPKSSTTSTSTHTLRIRHYQPQLLSLSSLSSLKVSNSIYSNPGNTTSSFVDVDSLWDEKQRLDAFLQENSRSFMTQQYHLQFEQRNQQKQDQQLQQQQQKKDVWNARLLLIGAAALYGTNFSFVKLLGDVMPVGVSSTMRFGLAAFATLPWLLQPSRGNEKTVQATLAGFEVGMWNSIGYIAQAVGLATTDASKSAFLCSLAVVVVPLLDFLFGKKLLPREIAGVFLAVLGVAVLELGGADATDLAWSSSDICSLVQPLAFGVGFWKMESAMRRFPNEANRTTAAQLLAIFLASAAYGSAVGFPSWNVVSDWIHDPGILGALFWTGCITTALTVYMETLALKTLSAAETTLIFSTEPLWGAACASIVMNEQLGWGTLGGGAFILGGCIVSNLGLEGILSALTRFIAMPATAVALDASEDTPSFMETSLIELSIAEEVVKNAGDSL